MFRNEVIVTEEDKAAALYHIQQVNAILGKYPNQVSFAETITNMRSAKTMAQNAERWISRLYTSA